MTEQHEIDLNNRLAIEDARLAWEEANEEELMRLAEIEIRMDEILEMEDSEDFMAEYENLMEEQRELEAQIQ